MALGMITFGYAAGFGAKPMIWMSRRTPDRAFDALIKRAAGVPA